MSLPTSMDRAEGALLGAGIGDALAMPVHWYYDRMALVKDYGRVDRFLPPKNPHPDSILWRSHYEALNERGEILHDQAGWWGKRGIHYHQFLEAGENTVTWQLALLTLDLIRESGRYCPEAYLRRYIQFHTTPGSHRDTYLEECHRGFFTNLARGQDPASCAISEKHIGGLAGVVPVVTAFRSEEEGKAVRAAQRHVGTTHAGKSMAEAVALVASLLWRVLNGENLLDCLVGEQRGQANRFVRHPFERWCEEPDEKVVGRKLSPACYLEDSVPATLYLAMKYHDQPREALVVNTMLGGDNVHRGIVLGALLGAESGGKAWPKEWVEGLRRPASIHGVSVGDSEEFTPG